MEITGINYQRDAVFQPGNDATALTVISKMGDGLWSGEPDNAARVFRQGGSSPTLKDDLIPSPATLLTIVNQICKTDCQDVEMIDASATWGLIVELLRPHGNLATTLALWCQAGMTQKDVAAMLGIPLYEVQRRIQKAMYKLRHPCRVTRIRHSIMGWPNLYRTNL